MTSQATISRTRDAAQDEPRPSDPTPDEVAERSLHRDLGLGDELYATLVDRLGRRPTFVEASVAGVMWSEHCSYASSRHLLRTLPTEGERVLQGPGENAGVIDVGDGWAAAFKVESHNHPSAIEPFHGAATGVGGILRDVFTMGARPVAVLDSLRVGPLDGAGDPARAAAVQGLLRGIVSGVAGYGNCVGVPTVGGELAIHPGYERNPLVNAMCIGLMRHDELQRGAASGVGNPVVYVGARTGRDGIHGATFASVEDPHEHERSAVQVGDPFLEKLLIEACLELLDTGAVVGMQDMGAAGLTSSSVEMAARAGSGIRIDLDEVPAREQGMTAAELLLSESQERMLVVMRRGSEHLAEEVFSRWGLDATVIGSVTDTGRVELVSGGTLVGDLPLGLLVDESPSFERPVRAPEGGAAALAAGAARVRGEVLAALAGREGEAGRLLDELLATPAMASTRWVHRQYDSMVGAATVTGPGAGAGDAAVVAIRGTSRAIAASLDCSARWCALEPRLGAMHAVAEAARNVTCAGGEPVAVTNCLNFSTPEDPAIAWQLAEAVAGMGEACRALGTPVVSGNVSLYNRSGDVDVPPSPVIGAVGVVADPAHVTPVGLQRDGSALVMCCDEPGGVLAGSELAAMLLGEPACDAHAAPPLDLDAELAVQRVVREAIAAGRVRAAHDVSSGGLAAAVAEMAFAGVDGARGACVRLPARDAASAWEALLGEGRSRIVLEVAPADVDELQRAAREAGVRLVALGETGGDRLAIRAGEVLEVDVEVDALARGWATTLERIMDGPEGAGE